MRHWPEGEKGHMDKIEFAISWDYRCPFARNLHEHVVVALEAGAPWDVTWWPFSLNQAHVAEGEPDVWDDPSKASSLLAMQVGIAARDRWPDAFPTVHCALFVARHDESRDIREEDVLREVITSSGLDADEVLAEATKAETLERFRKEHERGVADHNLWGVPTIVADGQAVFIRVMHRPQGDSEVARSTVDRLLDLTRGWPDLNEFKHTSIAR
jgi:DSBA-like thioredoxin domain-containing protein